MGQKINPISARLGITRSWDSRWFTTPANYAAFLHEDIFLRDYVKKRFHHAGVASILIERRSNRINILIATARPGIIIGPKGSEIDSLRRDLEQRTGKTVTINIEEVKRTELSAQLVAENIASQLQRRIGFRRAMKKTMRSVMDAGALGIKIGCSGRLGGPRCRATSGTARAACPCTPCAREIDFGLAEARTKFGAIGIKVWIFKGEVFAKKAESRTAKAKA